MFEMLTGILPFEAENATALALKHLRDDAPWVTELNPNIPMPIAKIIRKVMAKEPSARYRTANQLSRILQAFSAESAQVTAAVPATPPAPITTAPSRPPQITPQPATPITPVSVPAEEFEDLGPDWIAIFLGAAAILAILGLIPLWIMVYRAYRQASSEVLPIVIFTTRLIFGIIS
jgi:serine/threonine-protein kinase